LKTGCWCAFVLGVEHATPRRLVFGVEGLLFAGLAVVRPKIIAPAEHAESLFHTLFTFQF
jgi:hypothetical protein